MDRLGRDTIHREGCRVIVESPVLMPEWKASKFRPTEIVYQGDRFYVAEVSRGPDGRHRYRLDLWPEDLFDRPSRTILYEEEYVRLRDGDRSRAWLGLLAWPVLVLASPALGCLWNASKRGLQRRIGVDPRMSTLQSLFGEYVLALLLGVATYALMLGGSSVANASPLSTLAGSLVLLLDAAMRYDHLQKHPEDFLGVGEWLARWRH